MSHPRSYPPDTYHGDTGEVCGLDPAGRQPSPS